MPYEVMADLVLEVDGVPAMVTGSGDTIVVYSAHPAGVVAALSGTSLAAGVGVIDGPRALGRVADLLNDAGLRVTFSGPRGQLADLGSGRPSAVGRWVTGSAYVRLGRPAALRPLVTAALVLRVTGRRLAWGTAAVVVLGLALRAARTTGS